MKYVFKKYDPYFPKLFLEEKERLGKALGEKVFIEHVGSTAVPGLGGKGIVDIAIGVEKNLFSKTWKSLKDLGYEFKPNAGTEKRLFFQTKRENQVYHIHLTDISVDEWKRMLAFRNYLKTHPKEAKEYAEAKMKAAKESGQDKDTYMKIKEPVISRILNNALSEKNIKNYS